MLHLACFCKDSDKISVRCYLICIMYAHRGRYTPDGIRERDAIFHFSKANSKYLYHRNLSVGKVDESSSLNVLFIGLRIEWFIKVFAML